MFSPRMKLASNQLHYFFFMWSFAASVHLSAHWTAHWTTALAFALNLFVLLLPEEIILVLLAACAQLIALATELPSADNHFLLMGLVNLALLFYFASSMIMPSQSWQNAKRFTLTVQYSLALLYFFAVFHKLNYDFFNPAVSCVGNLMDLITLKLTHGSFSGAVPNSVVEAGIPMTLLVEAAIPILLFTRWKKWALVLGFLFHSAMAMIGVHNFSSVVFALYASFFVSEGAKPINFNWRITSVVFLLGIAYLTRTQAFHGFKEYSIQLQSLEFGIWWVLSATFLLPLLIREQEASTQRFLGFANCLVLALIAFNGLAPYLGVKTVGSFTMYSNLRTEDKFTNHILLPAELLRVVDLEDDVVQILEGSSPYFNTWIFSEKKLPYFEFQAYMNELSQAQQGALPIKYLRKGKVYSVAHINEEKEFLKPPSQFLRKLIAFHPVLPKEKSQTCQW